MEKEALRWRLPENPPKGMVSWVKENCGEELGRDITVFRHERIRPAPPLEDIMEYNTLKGKSVWATYCSCHACGESYYTEKVEGADAFYVIDGEDGVVYTADPGGNYDGTDGTMVPVEENDGFLCPICGAETRAVKARSIRGGRTKQIQVASLHAIDGYAVIVYWLVRRNINEFGSFCDAVPRYAFALGEKGGIQAFSHVWANGFYNETRRTEWAPVSKGNDRWDTVYNDWGSINSKKAGTVMYPNELPSLIGTTGEKTGLLAYWKSGGEVPINYLKIWKKWKPIENVCNSGFANLVAEAIGTEVLWMAYKKLEEILDMSKKKPHEILRIGKSDFKEISKWSRKPETWEMKLWGEYHKAEGKLGALEFFETVKVFHKNGINAAVQLMEVYYDCDIPKLRSYMEKQGLQPSEVGLLLDTRRMYRQITGRRELTEEESFPRHLQAAHDRLAAQMVACRNAEKAMEYQKGFEQVLEKFGQIQWTDKELAVILPKCNGDLIREGDVLRHCVGGYGHQHSTGESIILFIRHYRRPERPYYTLNISFKGSEPKEVQLHGYGNEHHGDHKQYRHSIPEKVRQFVDRWEKEVLLPWWREQKKKERKTA